MCLSMCLCALCGRAGGYMYIYVCVDEWMDGWMDGREGDGTEPLNLPLWQHLPRAASQQ